MASFQYIPSRRNHGHPDTEEPGKVNSTGTSTTDKNTAQSAGITVYAINAFTGSTGTVSRVNSDGKSKSYIGTSGSFNMAQGALNQIKNKRK